MISMEDYLKERRDRLIELKPECKVTLANDYQREIDMIEGHLKAYADLTYHEIKSSVPKIGAVIRVEETREFLLGFYKGATNGNK